MNEFTKIPLTFLETNFKIQTLLYIGNSNKGIKVKIHVLHSSSIYKPNKFYIGNSFLSFLYPNTSKKTNFPFPFFPLSLSLSLSFLFPSFNYNQTKRKYVCGINCKGWVWEIGEDSSFKGWRSGFCKCLVSS